jgi:hypothetical protein
MNPFDPLPRKLVSIHEAGHAVVGLVLAPDPTELGLAILTADHSGNAPLPTGLNQDGYIAAVAAGPIATALLKDRFQPQEPEPKPEESPVPLPVHPIKLPDGSTATVPPGSVSDEVLIAQDCIKHVEGKPWRWIENYETLMEWVTHLVVKHAPLILAVAQKVYAEGRWIGSREDLLKLIPDTEPEHVAPATTAGLPAQMP